MTNKLKTAKKIRLTNEEAEALVSPRLRARANDPRSKEQVISDIHKSRKQMTNRARAGTALSAGGLAAGIGSFVPKSSKAQAIMAGGGLAAMLAGMGTRSSARSKQYKLHRDKKTLVMKIQKERGSSKGKKKKASVEKIATDGLGFMDTQRAYMRAMSSGDPEKSKLIVSKDNLKRRLKAQGKGFLTGGTAGALLGALLGGSRFRGAGALAGGFLGGGIGQTAGQLRSDSDYMRSKGINVKWHGLSSSNITPEARAKYFPEHKKLTDKTASSKLAKLRVHNIEDELGDYLSDNDEARVRQMITKAKKKSFAMRHPILTGIPTLGIAPAMAEGKAKKKIIRQLAKSDPKMRKQLRKMRATRRKERHEKEVARLGATKVNVTQSREGERSKAASVEFAVGLRIASDTLYGTYMDKTANSPMFLARLGKLLSSGAAKASPHVSKAWSGARRLGRSAGEGIEAAARDGSAAAAKAFPEAAKSWANILNKNPQLASALSSAKQNWRPLAGGAAAGQVLLGD